MAEKISRAFEAKFPGVAVRVERTGAERVFTRIGQEYSSRVHAVDVVNSSDAAHFIVWKRDGWLAPYLPEDVAKHYPADHRDPDGMFASFRVWLCIIAYNSTLVKADEAPKSFADLLDPKWIGKIVKAHPGYSGTIMTATYQMQRDLGWGYFEKLAKQKIMQVQSSADPPKKLALGERSVMADGNEYNVFQIKESGQPVEPVYATEGSPLIVGPNGIFKNAPNPNAARLFQSYCFTPECQQLIIDVGGLRSVHPQTKEKAGPQAVQGHQDHEGRCGARSRNSPRRSRSATPISSGSDARQRPLTLVLPQRAQPRPAGIDLTRPILYLFAAILCVLIVLPISWLVYYSITEPRRRVHARRISVSSSPRTPSSSR